MVKNQKPWQKEEELGINTIRKMRFLFDNKYAPLTEGMAFELVRNRIRKMEFVS